MGDVAAAHAAPRRPASGGGAGRRTRPAAAPRERACAWTLPVATVGTPSRRASCGERAVARAVVALEGPLQLDPQVVGPEDGEQPPQRRLVVHALVARSRSGSTQPGGVLLAASAQRRPPGGGSSLRFRGRATRCARRDDPAEVAPARRVLDQQRDVAPVRELHLRPVDRPQPERPAACANSIEPETPLWSVSAIASVAELGRRGRQLIGRATRRPGTRRPSGRGARRTFEHMFA